MLTKEELKDQIVDGIKAGRLDPCNGVEFGDIYSDLPQYYWCIEDGEVTEESPFYADNEQPKFRFGVTVADIENFTEKGFGELSDDEVKQAMLDIVDESGVDDWYDQYQEV
ncbi:hypothetical protein BTI91_04265 [Lactobacillus delbrueckii subsp. bulgaricus]|nr:hypothetical protein [Lactobacillus delbrueckii subsp. bulgaricus]